GNLLPPRHAVARRNCGEQLLKDTASVTDQRDVAAHRATDGGAVDIDVHDLRARGKGGRIARHAVVEAHADADEQVGGLNRLVDVDFAVHARHPEVQLVR